MRSQIISKGKYLKLFNIALKKIVGVNFLDKFNYKNLIKHFYTEEDKWPNVYPTLLPQYDRSPRSGRQANILYNSTPALFKKSIEYAMQTLEDKDNEHKILFLQSWNEWAEGNYMEPDLLHGHQYLNALNKGIS